ncbi:hypothetical protein Tco_1445136 [Tanacetum coccineum]
MAQQIIPAAQLVPKFQCIKRCNKYVVLQSIPCSPKCKIVGKILLDHPLSYALTAIDDVPAVYLQQFWKTIHKVSDTKDTIRFKLDAQEITYTVDMFRDTHKLLVETPDNPFFIPVIIRTIESFMQTVCYQGVVDKVSDFYTKFIDQPWQKTFKVLNRCLTTRTSRHDQTKINILQLFHVVVNHTNVDYAALLWVPTFTANSPQGKKRKQSISESSSPKKSHKITIRNKKQIITPIPPPGDDRERDKVAEATILSLTLHKTDLAAKSHENIAKVQEKLDEEEIERMVEGEEDEESYASEFSDSMLNDDVDDSGTRIEPESYKEHPENVNDDDEEIEKEKKDDEI